MIAGPPMRWRSVILVAVTVLLLSNRGWSQTAPVTPPAASANGEEWRTTDLSMLDFVADGYELVSVISASSHTRIYFLTKPGNIVKCREEVTPNSPPPMPPPSPNPGQVGSFIPPPPDVVVTSVGTEFECAVLSRRNSRQ
jgi:hypothetical protein